MILNHNIASIATLRQLNKVEKNKKQATEHLSTGYKINRSADNAAGLCISEKMRNQIRGLRQGSINIQDGISLVQTADGALDEVQKMMHRITELCVKSANDTNDPIDRLAIHREVVQITSEIQRIGKNTNYNGLQLFDDMFHLGDGGSVTTIVSSPAADTGYLSEAYKVGSSYYPSATINFSGINKENVKRLHNQGFSFNCSQGCSEVFDIKFVVDNTPSSCSDLDGRTTHHYIINIGNCTTGSQVVNTIYSYVQGHLPKTDGASTQASKLGGVRVSHSNDMLKTPDGNGLVILANGAGNSTASGAIATAKGWSGNRGKISCSALTAIQYDDLINELYIQCSGEADDDMLIHTHRMNNEILGLDDIDVTYLDGALMGISKSQRALKAISEWRSELGAFQNRMTMAQNNRENQEWNVQVAESAIRDADMYTDEAALAKESLLEQVGTAMLAQANQEKSAVITLINSVNG